MSQVFVCPECGEQSDQVRYSCTYTETGKEWGNYAAYNGHDTQDSESRDYDTCDHDYSCPKCDHVLRNDPDGYFYEEDSEEMYEAIREAKGEDEEVAPEGGNE